MWFLMAMQNYFFYGLSPRLAALFYPGSDKAARTAVQEIDLPLIYVASFPDPVPGKKREVFVIAFFPFTFSIDNKMIMQMSEVNGGRMLSLSASHKSILKARPVSLKNRIIRH
jgi:hypothetical protein